MRRAKARREMKRVVQCIVCREKRAQEEESREGK